MSEYGKAGAPAMEKGAAILQFLADEGGPCNLTDICRATALPKSSVFTLLGTMEQLGFVRRTGTVYTLGMRLYTLGCKALELTVSAQTYRPALQQLRDATGFTVHFCMYDNGMITVLDKLDGRGVVQFKAYKGEHKRLNTSAGGKALAAFLPDEEIHNVISGGFDHFTETSISTSDVFLRHLEGIRRTGYSIDDGEGEVGVRCLGAPVFVVGGQVFGGVSLTTISSQLPLDSIPQYAELLLAAAAKVSRALSYGGPYPLPQCDPSIPHPYLEEVLRRHMQEYGGNWQR